MTEIWPFVALVVVQIPLPLSNIFMLVICVGTDIYPALSLAYEEAEVDIMTRRPRKPEEHLVSAKLLGHAYGNMGELATCGGFFTYNIVMTCYGFPVSIYWELLSKSAYTPTYQGAIDYTYNIPITFVGGQYNPNLPNVGATNYFTNACNTPNNLNLQPNTGFPNWLSTTNNMIDLRAVFVNCCESDPTTYCSQFQWPTDYLDSNSPITGQQAAFTTEALYYAQSSYFVTIVMIQWSNVFACKSRKVFFYLCR